ncbi:glutamyl-tRNA synthetase [Barrientosiimonas humi]|uniref:Glutamate--tRNA ligase n=1 Tax=Barrientosiimonas humi TaxID=999931 RepID=A0A542XDA7_9MICO|nr:glutamate--tRNA ligase [Barrientosiimonas humi]TQL33784.1 glutamyl-tRNA synthetase [Barrientosiimonas humi]CAG7573772.1 Glutamate--tRNA ligase [Barrientosiimonas humi]
MSASDTLAAASSPDPDAPVAPPRLRVAPSPTGDPHVGTAYMAMFDLAYARKHGGQFVLRIEDTDRARFVEGSEQQVYDTLAWLGLSHDEGPDVGGPYAPYRQSERLDTYQPYVDKLLAEGKAYYCWCSAERLKEMREKQQALKQPTGYDRLCYGKTEEERAALPGFSDKPVVRMLIPDDVELEWDDLIMGRTSAPRPDDQVILKADGFPTYHLAVVVDDHEMAITHVVRGQEWISSTPKHLLLYKWLEVPAPRFAHMPLLRDEKRAKISKRKNPAARLTWFQEQGYLPEALLNFLALQGYPPIVEADGTEREVFTFEEFTQRFEWAKVNKAGAVFNLDKLNWLNGHYIRELDAGDLASRLIPFLHAEGLVGSHPTLPELGRLKLVAEQVQTRITTLQDAVPLVRPFYVADDELEIADDARATLKDGAAEVLDAAIAALEPIDGGIGNPDGTGVEWLAPRIEAALREAIIDGLGIKPRLAFGPLRVAIAGQKISTPLFESMEILGKHSTMTRLRALRDQL